MTDEEKAQLVLEALAGIRRCDYCHELEQIPWLALLEQYNGLICFSCWLVRRKAARDRQEAWRAEFINNAAYRMA